MNASHLFDVEFNTGVTAGEVAFDGRWVVSVEFDVRTSVGVVVCFVVGVVVGILIDLVVCIVVGIMVGVVD